MLAEVLDPALGAGMAGQRLGGIRLEAGPQALEGRARRGTGGLAERDLVEEIPQAVGRLLVGLVDNLLVLQRRQALDRDQIGAQILRVLEALRRRGVEGVERRLQRVGDRRDLRLNGVVEALAGLGQRRLLGRRDLLGRDAELRQGVGQPGEVSLDGRQRLLGRRQLLRLGGEIQQRV